MKILLIENEKNNLSMFSKTCSELEYKCFRLSMDEVILCSSTLLEYDLIVLSEEDFASFPKEYLFIKKEQMLECPYYVVLKKSTSIKNSFSCHDQGVHECISFPISKKKILDLFSRYQTYSKLRKIAIEYKDKNDSKNKKITHIQNLMDEANDRFSNLFHELPIACFTTDVSGNIYEWNQESEYVYGYLAHEVFGKNIYDFMITEEYREYLLHHSNKCLEKLTRCKMEYVVQSKDGNFKNVLSYMIPLYAQHKKLSGIMIASIDITRQKKLEQELKRQFVQNLDYTVELEINKNRLKKANSELKTLSTTDELTGIKNHRSFKQILKDIHEKHEYLDDQYSLMMVDIDFFKKYNDTFGHPAGDKVLKNVGLVLKNIVRSHDYPFRYGGEEFSVILPFTSEEESMEVASRIRKAIEECRQEHRFVTVSIGVATRKKGERSDGSLVLSQADQALYFSKRNGRNCVTHYHSIFDSTLDSVS